MAPKKKKAKTTINWRYSDARKIIFQDLEDGIFDPETMSPREAWEQVYKHHKAFKNVPWEQFEENFQNNCDQFLQKRQRRELEEMLYQHDKALHPRTNPRDSQGRLIFHRHAAKDLLRTDIQNGLYPQKKPEELWHSHPEYEEFELKVFTQRIYQEIRRNKYINYANDKREAKAVEVEVLRRDRDYTFS